ncbi:MAG: amidohydrolase family protein [Candidatus Hydrogenedentota bacterium]
MARRKRSPFWFFIIAIAVLLGAAKLTDWVLPALESFGRQPRAAAPHTPSAAVEGPRDSAERMAKMRADKKIINVHEHVERLEDAERLLEVMDRFGVGKTILVGSSWFTITLDESVGFTRVDENNEELLRVVKAHPGRFEAWPTFDPHDPKNLEKFKSQVERGATGLKLFMGHGYVKRSDGQYMFHTMALDDPRMFPVYDYCQENFLPIMYHVQLSPEPGPGISDEFVAVLKKFPDMKVICPHYMLSSGLDSRLREMLDMFPNLYTDISYGHDSFIVDGMERIDKAPEKFVDLFTKYPGRFMWGTDLVVTTHASKSVPWMAERFQTYFDMLTEAKFTTPLVKGREMRGVAIDGPELERILHQNYEDFSALRPMGTRTSGDVDWSRMGKAASNTGRKPGEMLPPPKK